MNLPLVLILSSSIALIWAENAPSNPKKINFTQIIDSTTAFQGKYFEIVANETVGNFASSPLGVSILLMMASYGTVGITQKEILNVLGLDHSSQEILNNYRLLMKSLIEMRDIDMKIANGIFHSKSVHISRNFKRKISKSLEFECEGLNFERPRSSAQKINEWVYDETSGDIEKIVTSNELFDATMIFLNAIYFKGQWAQGFNIKYTSNGLFYNGQQEVKTKMMHLNHKFHWGKIENIEATYVELPYKNKNYSMFMILPKNESNGMSQLEQYYQQIDFSKLNGTKEKINLRVPKFRIESNLNLRTAMEKLNITTMFTDNANFSMINRNIVLSVDGMKQKTFIEVNEAGHKASFAKKSSYPQLNSTDLPEIIFNRPFIWVIVMKNHDKVMHLLYGRVINPTYDIFSLSP